jgi:hypothetical protein
VAESLSGSKHNTSTPDQRLKFNGPVLVSIQTDSKNTRIFFCIRIPLECTRSLYHWETMFVQGVNRQLLAAGEEQAAHKAFSFPVL